MKFSLIAAVVVLALAQGSFAQDASDLERLTQMFEDMKSKVTLEVSEFIRTHNLADQAQNFMEDKKSQLEPLAAQLQEQFQAAATNMQEHMKPLAANVQGQFQPMVDNFQKQMEELLQRLTQPAVAN